MVVYGEGEGQMTESGEHAHEWDEVGLCEHPHATGVQGGTVYRCRSCRRYGHQISTFLCVARQAKADIPPPRCPLVNPADWEGWWLGE